MWGTDPGNATLATCWNYMRVTECPSQMHTIWDISGLNTAGNHMEFLFGLAYILEMVVDKDLNEDEFKTFALKKPVAPPPSLARSLPVAPPQPLARSLLTGGQQTSGLPCGCPVFF